MFTVTESARALLAQLLEANNASENEVVRFHLIGEKLNPGLGNVRPGDVTFEHAGKTVLALDQLLSKRLMDNTLDVHEAGDGRHLSLR